MRYFRIFLLYFQEAFVQKERSFVWFLVALFNPLLLLIFWFGVFHDRTVTVEGWTLSHIATYYFLVVIAGAFLITHNEEDIAVLDIQEGGLVNFIIKPFSYFWIKFLNEVSWRLIQGIFGIIVFILMSFFFNNLITLSTSLEVLLPTILIIILAFFISFTFKMILGLSALWVTDFWGLQQLSDVVILVLAGIVMPIDLFPKGIQAITFFTPFPYMVYYPIVALQGKLFVFQLIQVIAIQLVWLCVLCLSYRYMWQSGIRKFTGVGR